MLYGNRETLGIEIRPVSPTWDRRYLPERTAWATLLVWVGGVNLCQHRRRGASAIEDGPNVPLAPLVDWFVRSWSFLTYEERAPLFATSDELHSDLERWGTLAAPDGVSEDDWIDARESWWLGHFLQAGAEGAYVPYLALARQDERLILDWRTPAGRPVELEFLHPSGKSSIPWPEAQASLSAFARAVAESLAQEGLVELYPWVGSAEPLQAHLVDPRVALEIFTRRSQIELNKLTNTTSDHELRAALDLMEGSTDPGASPLTQVLRDLPPQLPESAGKVLTLLGHAIKQSSPALVRFRKVCADVVFAASTDEQAGYLGAAAIRGEVGLDGQPIDDVKGLMDFLGVKTTDSDVSIGWTDMVAGSRSSGGAAAILLGSERMSVDWARRFELARALGHLLLDQQRDDAVGCASSSFAPGSRRRRSGAFAAEFLLPQSALLQLTDARPDRAADAAVFREIMARYKVGATTAAYHLWNHGLLSSSDLRDDLIKAYASG